jgi:ABC-2 type transport system permease protein
MVVLLGLLHFDWTGYEKRLPGISEIKSIYMDSSFYPLTYQPASDPAAQAVDYMYTPVKAIYTDQENIARIHALHRQIIANGPDHKKPSLSQRRNTERICLAYELAGGKRMYRQYDIYIPDYTGSLKPIYESREYKEMHNQIFRVNPAEVDFIDIIGYESDKHLRLVDPVLIAQAIEHLKTDIYADTYEEIVNINSKPPWASINLQLTNIQTRSYSQEWKKTYTNFEQWLKDTGKYEQVRLLPGTDITCAFIDRVSVRDDKDLHGPYAKARRLDLTELEERPGILKITDPEQLEWCLRQYYRNDEQAAYEIFFVRNNGDVISGFLGEAGAPAFIQEHFAG